MNYLEEAKEIAKEAGALVMSRLGTGFATEEKSSRFDVVTEVDRASEELIRSRIREMAADHTFLGEEESFGSKDRFHIRLEQAQAEPNLWIVDPIDGTNNFVQGIPGFTISIAMACRGQVTIGVIYDPCREELFWAEAGKGAYLNGKPLRVSETASLGESVVATGFPSNPEARAAVMAGLQEVTLHCRTVRSLGSAALHLAYVAAGRLTAFWENGLNIWDTAAGALIVREAGGVCSDTRGNPFGLMTRDVFGSNGIVHQELLRCLK